MLFPTSPIGHAFGHSAPSRRRPHCRTTSCSPRSGSYGRSMPRRWNRRYSGTELTRHSSKCHQDRRSSTVDDNQIPGQSTRPQLDTHHRPTQNRSHSPPSESSRALQCRVVHDRGVATGLELTQDLPDQRRLAGPPVAHDEQMARLDGARDLNHSSASKTRLLDEPDAIRARPSIETRRRDQLRPFRRRPCRRSRARARSFGIVTINPTSRPEASIAFGTFVEDQWKALVLPTFKASTQHGYKTVLNVHVLPAWRDWRLRDIERLAIQQWVADKFRQGTGWQTVRNAWVLLSSVLETAME